MKNGAREACKILHELRHWFNLERFFAEEPANEKTRTIVTANCAVLISRALTILNNQHGTSEIIKSISQLEFEKLMDKLSSLAGEVKHFEPWRKIPHIP
jgi:hypothetical protein